MLTEIKGSRVICDITTARERGGLIGIFSVRKFNVLAPNIHQTDFYSSHDGLVRRTRFWWTHHPVLWLLGGILVSVHSRRNFTWHCHIASS